LNAYLQLLKLDGTMTLVGAPEKPASVAAFNFLMKSVAGGFGDWREFARRRRCWISAESTGYFGHRVDSDPEGQRCLRAVAEERREISLCD